MILLLMEQEQKKSDKKLGVARQGSYIYNVNNKKLYYDQKKTTPKGNRY